MSDLIPFHPKLIRPLVGRAGELQQLKDIASAGDSAMIIVYGRRRIGKTALLNQAFFRRNLLKFEGLEGRSQSVQKKEFLRQLSIYANDPHIAALKLTRWVSIFEFLAKWLQKGSWTLYFEELQWMASYRNELASELKPVWDNFFSKNSKLILVLCGSSPSFMLNQVVKSKAHYNRSQHVLHVKEFGPEECRRVLGGERSNQELLEAMLLVGGVPEYLKYLKRDSSVRLSLARESFSSNGFFVNEHDKIFVSTLGRDRHYRKILEFLSRHRHGSREQIKKYLGIKTGGRLSEKLEELELCGFIERYVPFDLAHNSVLERYAITDQFLGFHYKFIHPLHKRILKGEFDQNPWAALNQESFQKWLGFAFEKWCRKHHAIFAKILGFSGVHYTSGAYFDRASNAELLEGKNPGFQIDLVFDRADRVLTVCEIKNTIGPVRKSVTVDFDEKLDRLPFRKKRTIQRVLITVSPPDPGVKNSGYFDRIIGLDDIFSA